MPDALAAAFPPVTGRAAWYGADVARTDEWIERLAQHEIAEIDAAIAHFRASGTPLEAIDVTSFPLPTLAGRIEALLDELLDGRGFFLLRGLPLERYDLETAAIAYLGIGRHFGTLRSSNAKGHLLGLPDVYAPRYGSVTPGDRGGIVVPGTRLSVSLEA
jgi:hypothetical protein